MRNFCNLYQTLDQTTSTNAKVAAMREYFSAAPASDAAWAVYFLSGRRIKRLVGAASLRAWLTEHCELPAWLIEDTYASVGDLAETIALLLAEPGESLDHRSLQHWVEQEILPLKTLDATEQQRVVTQWWNSLTYEPCYIFNKLLTGALRVGVSQTLLARALAEHAGLPRTTILHRLMGEWSPDADFFQALIAEDDGEANISRPYPFYLASPLDDKTDNEGMPTLGDASEWLAEWKWDGIRAQLIRRTGQTFLWSRGEELIGQRFPEITAAAEQLQDGTVLDGEIVPWNTQGIMAFAELQRRIGRKTVGKKLLADVPCRFMAYDLLELESEDVRTLPLFERRARLESILHDMELLADTKPAATNFMLSQTLEAASWQALGEHRQTSRDRGVEGVMLKHRNSPYETGRKRGLWWKWKVEPHTVDAVMMYAQAGHGKRANLFTDYTFGVWHEENLVPIAKAYSGLDNKEISELDKWIRRHTEDKFGPVRAVEQAQVFELAFEGINLSSRHKSGIAVRFPRIARWRKDLAPKDADSLDDVKRLIVTAPADAT